MDQNKDFKYDPMNERENLMLKAETPPSMETLQARINALEQGMIILLKDFIKREEPKVESV